MRRSPLTPYEKAIKLKDFYKELQKRFDSQQCQYCRYGIEDVSGNIQCRKCPIALTVKPDYWCAELDNGGKRFEKAEKEHREIMKVEGLKYSNELYERNDT